MFFFFYEGDALYVTVLETAVANKKINYSLRHCLPFKREIGYMEINKDIWSIKEWEKQWADPLTFRIYL